MAAWTSRARCRRGSARALPGLLARRSSAAGAPLDRDIADIDAALGEQLDAVLHAPAISRARGTLAGPRLADLRHRARPPHQGAIAADLLDRALPRPRAGPRVRPERDLPADLRGRVRHARRRAVRADGDRPRRPTSRGARGDDRRCGRPDAALRGRRGRLHAGRAVARSDGAGSRRHSPTSKACATSLRRCAAPITCAGAASRGRADMRFVAVTLPRLLARHPWTDDPSRVDGFRYCEYAPDAQTRACG